MSMSMSGVFAPLRVGEPLEEQAVPDRVHVGDAQAVAQQRADAAAARRRRDAVAPRAYWTKSLTIRKYEL